jgi:hypothetical protein
LRVLFGDEGLGTARVLLHDPQHRGAADGKAVVLLEPLGGVGERLLGAEVAQRALHRLGPHGAAQAEPLVNGPPVLGTETAAAQHGRLDPDDAVDGLHLDAGAPVDVAASRRGLGDGLFAQPLPDLLGGPARDLDGQVAQRPVELRGALAHVGVACQHGVGDQVAGIFDHVNVGFVHGGMSFGPNGSARAGVLQTRICRRLSFYASIPPVRQPPAGPSAQGGVTRMRGDPFFGRQQCPPSRIDPRRPKNGAP